MGCIPFSWVDPVLRFRASSGFCGGGLQSGPAGFVNQHASVPDRFSKTCARRAPRLGARAEEGIMTVETRDSEFRRPEAVAFLRSLTDEEEAKHLPLVREHDGVVTHCWREGGRVCRRGVAVDAALPGLQDIRHGRRVGSGKLIGRRHRNSDARARGRQAGGTDALLAAGCCLENMRCPDFLERRACRGAAALSKA